MYTPKYTITNKILQSIGQIEAAREVVTNAPLVPSFEKQFKDDAIVRTVHHGTHIEGNDLTIHQARKVIEGENVYAKPRDVQEVINYRNVVKLLSELSADESFYSTETLKKIHSLTIYRIIPEEKSGALRNTQVVIKEEGTGEIILRPPSFVEVPYLLDDFFAWLNSQDAQLVHPTLRAGIAHYVLVSIHPFVEGNGRTIRAFSNLILIKEGYDIKKFFALEEHFDRDLADYYEAFALVDKLSANIRDRDLTTWLEYFCQVVAIELVKIKDKVRRLSIDSRLKVKIGKQIALTERQMKLVEYLSDRGEGKMSELKQVFRMVSDDTILRDLQDLMKKGLLIKEGKTKAARYILKK